MYQPPSHRLLVMESFRLKDHMMRDSVFIPKLYNLCKSLGFEHGKILPSGAISHAKEVQIPVEQ